MTSSVWSLFVQSATTKCGIIRSEKGKHEKGDICTNKLDQQIIFQKKAFGLTNSLSFALTNSHPLLEPEFNRSKSPICAALDSDRRTP